MARSINLKGFKEYEKKLKEAPKKLSALADAEASAAATNIANSARTLAPNNLGGLRSSINPSGSNGRYKVTAAVDYAAYIEFGTKSRVQVPAELQKYASQFKGGGGTGAKEAIYAWCKSKGIDPSAWFMIYLSIMRNGIHAHPFLFPSVDKEAPEFRKRVQNVLNKL